MSECEWVPEENLIECDEIIEKFDDSQVYEILGAKKTDNGDIFYLTKYKDGWTNGLVSSGEALAKWPSLVIEYLERQISMVSSQAVNGSQPIVECNMPGNPIRVTCKFQIY